MSSSETTMTRIAVCLVCCGLAAGCSADPEGGSLTLATTTSTRDSGLLKPLLQLFERRTGIEVHVVAVGSGQALELGRRGDADVLLTHAPEAEAQFVSDGYGVKRRPVMQNDFVIVGPPADPAALRQCGSVAEAFRRIFDGRATMVSRGDESGTHIKERQLWQAAGLEPAGDWYLRAGAGMAATLRLADEKLAYTLCDRGTFLAQQGNLDLQVAFEGDPLLKNGYAVICVNPQKHPHVRSAAAGEFADFLLSSEAQDLIARFGTEQYGEPLFFRTTDGVR